MAPPPCLTILVLTEDSGAQAPPTLTALLKKIFGLLVTGVQTHRIAFEPQSERERAAMRGNLWKSTKARDQHKIVDLRRSIANKLLEEEPPGFVVFHVDGDCPWSERSVAQNPRSFEEKIRTPVGQLIQSRLASLSEGPGPHASVSNDALPSRQSDAEHRLRCLMTLIPYYEIEAWLYQNLDEVRKHCCGKPEHSALIEKWTSDRASLDEEIRPKKEALPCLADKHNEPLARGFDAPTVFGVEKSFHAAVVDILQNGSDFLAALESTRQVSQ